MKLLIKPDELLFGLVASAFRRRLSRSCAPSPPSREASRREPSSSASPVGSVISCADLGIADASSSRDRSSTSGASTTLSTSMCIPRGGRTRHERARASPAGCPNHRGLGRRRRLSRDSRLLPTIGAALASVPLADPQRRAGGRARAGFRHALRLGPRRFRPPRSLRKPNKVKSFLMRFHERP